MNQCQVFISNQRPNIAQLISLMETFIPVSLEFNETYLIWDEN